MSGIRLLGRLVAIFAIVLFVVLFPIIILAYNSQAVATSGGFLASLAGDSSLFDAGFSMAAKGLAHDVPTGWATRDRPIARLNATQWEQILRTVTPPAMVQRLTQDALVGFGQWARYGGTLLEGVIMPFGQIRQNLVGDPNQTVLRTVTEAQPLCTAGQEPLSGGDELIPSCRPVPSDEQAFYRALAQRWAQNPGGVWRQLWPDATNLYTEDMSIAEVIRRGNPADWQGYRRGWYSVPRSVRGWYSVPRSVRGWFYTAWGLSLARGLLVLLVIGGVIGTLVTIALLAARNLPEALRWVGAPLFIAGLFTAGLGLLIWAGGWLWPFATMPVSDIPQEMQHALYGIGRDFAQRLLFPMAWQGIALAATGAILWGSSFLVPVRRSVASAAVAAAS